MLLQEWLYIFVTVPDLVATDYGTTIHVGGPAVLICNVTIIPPGTTITTYQWRRADMSPSSFSATEPLYLPYVHVSDAGVYICEATISDSTNNPYVISGTGSVNVTLTVSSK